MSNKDPGDCYSPEPNILEQKAARYLIRGAAARGRTRTPPGADSGALTSATRRAVTLAALAGIVSGGIIGGAEVWVRQDMLDGLEGMDWREHWPYWTGFFVFVAIISAIEIAFIYWISLRGVARITRESGLALGEDGYPGLFARGLARDALEFPSPRVHVLGIDPYAYVSRWRIIAKAVAYKMKVGVTSFLVRVFLRRVAARMAVRGFVPLVAGPLYAAWNAVIVWRVMHHARIRALGPPAAEAILQRIFSTGEPPRDAIAEMMLHGVGEMLRRGREAHPNYVYLLYRLREELEHESDIEVDWQARCAELGELSDDEQGQVLAVLAIAAVLGSWMRGGQKAMLREAVEACGRNYREDDLKALRSALMSGQKIGLEEVRRAYA
jgi:hypothetical protein